MPAKWKKSPERLVERFGQVVPPEPAVERRSMFGYPCAFLNGHMFCGLYQDHFILRLPAPVRVKFLAQPDAKIFEPMPGRPMKEYVLVPPKVLSSDLAMRAWLKEARAYVAALPPKARPRKEVNPKRAAARPARSPGRAKAKKGPTGGRAAVAKERVSRGERPPRGPRARRPR